MVQFQQQYILHMITVLQPTIAHYILTLLKDLARQEELGGTKQTIKTVLMIEYMQDLLMMVLEICMFGLHALIMHECMLKLDIDFRRIFLALEL